MRHLDLLCLLLATLYTGIQGSWFSLSPTPSARRLDVSATPVVTSTNVVVGRATNLSIVFAFSQPIPVNATLALQLPPPFAYVNIAPSLPLLAITSYDASGAQVLRSSSTTLDFSLNNTAAIAAGTVVNITLPNVHVPPSTGVQDTYHVALLDDQNQQVTLVSILGSVLQSAPLNLGYLGVQSLRAGQDAGLMVVFSNALDIPSNGEVIVSLNPSYQLSVNTTLHMLSHIGNYSMTHASSVLKIQRDGSTITSGSTIAFWLSSLLNPPTDGIVASPGVVSTATNEGYLLESTAMSSLPIYSAAANCLGQCAAGFYASAFNASNDVCTACYAGAYCTGGTGYYSNANSANCTVCPAGSYCATTSMPPVACTPGTYSSKYGVHPMPRWHAISGSQTSCTLCPAGAMCPTTTSISPLPCAQGTYSIAGATSCTSCPVGKYCPYVNQSVALACAPGTFSVGLASANCTLCPSGYQCPAVDGTGNALCPAGYFSTGGATACTKCPPGHACPSTDTNVQLPCSSGYYSTGGQTACVPCPAGFACADPTSGAKTACAFGTFSGGGQASCTPCPAGFLCPSVSNSSITPCGLGLYSLTGQGTCTSCPAGYSCSNLTTTPQPCAPGYYSLAGWTSCSPCMPGYECPHPDQPPQPCPIGYWSPGTILNCLECNPGYRCSLASTSPTPPADACPAGGYCNPPTTFFMCPPGTYGNTTAGESVDQACAPCPQGFYCGSGSTAVSMASCPPGFYCPVGTSYSSAFPCPAGQYNPNPNAGSSMACVNCPAGSYCPAGSPLPAICPSGSFCPAGTQSATQYLCPAGTFGGNNTGIVSGSQCIPCTVGNYCPPGSVSPTPCPAGRYNPSTSASGLYECLLCPQGMSCPHVGQIAVTDPCAPGHYCPVGTVSAISYPCPAGTYTDAISLVRINDCTICPERYACLSGTGNNMLQMLPCAAGFFCPNGTAFPKQFPCPPGYWSSLGSLAAASECTICPPGSYCAGGNSVIDGPCGRGHYCPIGTALPTTYPCPSGTYTALTNLTDPTQCTACPPGAYCPTGSVTPVLCPPGSYTSVTNTAAPGPGTFPTCTTCPSGFYCPLGSVAPLPCGVGKSSPMASFTCQACPAGYFCGSNTTATELLPTSAGTWNLRGSLFGRCYNGTYCPGSMNYEPTLETNACPQGYYCPMATPSPVYCPAGTFNNVTGQDALADCIPTPAGFFSLPASVVPTGECSPGYYCPSMSTSDTQVACPPRYYLNRTQGRSQDDCAVCPAGKYCTIASTVPTDCPRGYYCITGTSNPEPCPLGTYGNATGLKMMENCLTCLPGMYCDGTALTNPSGPCDAGFYCTAGSYTSAPSGSAGTSGNGQGGQYIGGLCQKGGYCPLGSSTSLPCPAGTFNNATGAQSFSDCTNCPPGYYCQSLGLSLPTDVCAAGYFCVSGATTPTQYESPIGHFSPAGAYSPSACPPGTFNNQVRQSQCANCPARFYCNGTATVQPAVCPQGYYCPASTALPQKCPAGTYSNLTGLAATTDCLSCPPGFFCQTSGLVQPSGPCMAGYTCTGGAMFPNPNGQSYGTICPAGMYCPLGSALPLPCPLGTYRPNTLGQNLTDCTPSPGGTFSNATGLTAPTGVCSAGYYCTSTAFIATPTDGVTGNLCPVGFFCPLGSSSPLKCVEGTYASSLGQALCTPCPAGSFCDGVLTDRHQVCPQGAYCPPSTGASQPPCPVGSFNNGTGLPAITNCTVCTPGSFCASVGLVQPTALCQAGFFCNAGAVNAFGQTTSQLVNGTLSANASSCPSGSYCPVGTYQPVPCPVGTYLPTRGGRQLSDCQLCTPGQYFDTTGAVAPSGPCDPGYFCQHNNAVARPTTNFCPSGSSAPTLCAAGTYSISTGASQCTPCPAGYYCPSGTSDYSGLACPQGFYCPQGTRTMHEYPCPKGTYSNQTMLQNVTQCVYAPGGMYVDIVGAVGQCMSGFYCLRGATSVSPNDQEELWAGQCPVGTFCPNATALPTPCEAGHYCASSDLQKASPCSPGFYCVQGSYTPTPTGQVVANGIIGNECPAGTYCPAGTSNPIPCPSGTFSSVKQLGNVTQCLPCSAGYSCPNTGTILPSVPCPPTVYCPGNNVQVTCPLGHYCPGGVLTAPVPCAAGSFANITGLAACFGCPARAYCGTGTIIPVSCPAGYYCPTNTTFAHEYPCLPGTFSNISALASPLECALCPPGQYCSGLPPTLSPTGPCAPGYFCALGARTRMPVDSTGGVCSDRFVCLGGASVSNPVDGVTGRLCNPGSFCVNGTEQACPLHTYAAIGGQSSCDACPLGRYCPGNTSVPSPCPQRYYCPVGPPVLCPNGTYGAQMGLELASQCSSCPSGMYCTDGTITGPCASGYFCKFGNYQPNPLNYHQSLLPWQQQSGGACPIGYYCTQNTTDPLPCPGNSSRLSPFGTELYDCAACPAGKSCLDGTVTVDCPVGYYCPYAQLPQPCPKGTVNDTAFDCPAGSFCLRGAPDASPCPAGTYLPTTGGSSVSSCRVCPAGYECPLGSITPIVCEAGFYCPAGSGNMTICAPGFYCPFNSTAGVPCSAGYYCPMGAFNQTACTFGTYCPPRASSPVPCPFGSLSLLRPNGSLYSSRSEACQLCPKGTYGNGANCTTCPEGFVCLEGCTSPTPRNASMDNGYPCPAGYYCGNGTFQEQPCPVGTFNPLTMGTSLNTSCMPCAANTYQYQVGQATCYPCSTSSNAALGSAQCQCVGQNRAFQKSDGYCICEPGYEYYDSNGILRSDSDDTADCQPVVYPRCGSSQVRSASGSCVDPSSVSCASACNGGTGTFLATSGICTCTNAPSLDSVCDSACRATTTQLRLNPLTSTLQYYDPSTNVYTPVPAADQGAITGSLSCNTNTSTSCQVLSMQVGGNAFSGTYSNVLPGTSQRRRLTASTGILNPMLCLQKSDSVLFSISGASYPVYMKDSLMNTNPSFDYGPFRSLQEAMASNASIVSAFAYTFTAAGTYVFALSNNSAALTIVTVMETGVKCPTDGPIVPMSQGNLIVLSAKPSSNIIMAPNWGLIAGLLCALFGVVAGMIGGLYYFRRKSWVAQHSSAGGYKDKARGFNLNNLHTKGSVVKKTAKAVNEADGAVLPEDLEAKPEVQASGDYVPELNRWDDDDLGIRELVDRLQFHHDSVEKAFHDQETGAAKMMKMLQNEADELKMLLASLVVAQKSQDKDKAPASNCDAELVLLDTLQKNAADRADFVASLSDAELRVANAARELHTLVHPKTSLAGAIMDELASPTLSSPTFATLLANLASFEASVVAETGLLPTLQSEANRRRVQSAVWKAFGHTTKELLPPTLLEAKAKCEAAHGESDGAAGEACDYLVKFASVVPTYTKKLHDFADTFRSEWQHAVEQQNPALLKPVRVKYEKVLGTLLKELQSGTTKLSQRVHADQQALTSARARFVPATTHLDTELAQLRDHLVTTQPIVVDDDEEPTSDVKELVTQLRALLANPGQLQFAAPALNLDKLIDDVATDKVAAHPAEAVMDDADEALLGVELRREVDRDNERLEKLKTDFLATLEAKPNLGEAERESLLDAFNEDMAHLQTTLALEREKHQEQLRNRLAIRKLKKDTELEALLQDEALEEEMLEKQEAEMQALERAFAEEQAKIEAEFDFGEPDMDFGEPDMDFGEPDMDFGHTNNDGDMMLPPSRNASHQDERADPVGRMLDSFDEKWREKQANLDDEHARAKQRLKDRLRHKRDRIQDPAQDALLHAAETLQAQLLDRAFETQRDKVRNEALLKKTMSMTPADALDKVVHDNAAIWAAPASGQPLPPELEQLQHELTQALEIEHDLLTSAQLLEKAQFSSLAESDQTTLDAIYKDFDAKWKERQALQESDEARNKRKLMERLQAKAASPRDAFAVSLDDVTEKALLHGLAAERDALETIGALLKANDASQANDADVAALQATFARDWARQKQLLATETALKRAQLAARLARQKQLIDAMPAGVKDAALAILAYENAIAERQVVRETDVATEALHAVILTDKATLDTLSVDDKAFIQRLLDEHATKWANRQRALKDDHAAAKANLARRLQVRGDAKPLSALAMKALDDTFKVAGESLALAALLEKAQLVAGVDTKWQQRRRELDMAEATVRHELQAMNEATPEALDELEHSMALQRETLELAADQEAHQVRALEAAMSGEDDKAANDDDDLRRVQSEYAAACARRQKELDDEAAARRAKLADRVRRQRLANEALPSDEKAAANHALEVEAAVETRQVELDTALQKEAIATSRLVQAAKSHSLSPVDNADIENLLASHEKKWADRNRLLADDQALAKAALADRLKKRQNKALNAVETAGLELHTNVVAEALATAALIEKVQLGIELSAPDAKALKELTTEHDAKWKKRRDELAAAEADGKRVLAQDPTTTPERIEELVAIVAKERELVDHLEHVEAAQLASLALPPSTAAVDDNEAAIASLQEAFQRHRQRERDLADAEAQL
ncbi:hypothetical protein SPRG_22196, partial [Saprolegnia parasitica CBS 223.65]